MFYFAQVLSALLVFVPAYIAFKKEGPKYKWALFLPALLGIVFSFCTSYNAHMEANRNADTAKRNDSLYKDLLGQNLKSAKKIIDSLDVAVINTKGLILQNNMILDSQKSVGLKLNRNLYVSNNIQDSVILSSRRLLTTLNTAEKHINDNITGGDGYVTIEIMPRLKDTYIAIKNPTRFLIPQVTVSYRDISKFRECVFASGTNYAKAADCLKSSEFSGRESTIYPYGIMSLEDIVGEVDTSGKEKLLSIEISLPKRRYREQLWYKYVNKQIIYRYRLIKFNKEWVPYYYSPDFKRDFTDESFDKLFYF